MWSNATPEGLRETVRFRLKSDFFIVTSEDNATFFWERIMYESEIKNLISMPELCDRYGIDVDRNGFILCPFHADGSPSCKIYPGNRGFHCFSCGAGGDVTDFTEQYFSLSHTDAIRKLNADFALGLPIDGYDRKAAEQRMKARKAETERKKAEEKRLRDQYWDLYDEMLGIETILKAFRPICMDIPPHPLFTTALIKKDQIEKELEFAELDLRRQKGQL